MVPWRVVAGPRRFSSPWVGPQANERLVEKHLQEGSAELQIPPRQAPRQAGAGGTGRLRSESMAFSIPLVVCGRKAPKSACEQASPGSFDSAP